MGDENPIHTLGDYSKPSHEGYRKTIKLLLERSDQQNRHVLKRAITDRIAGTLPSDTVKNPKLGQEEKGNLGNINPNPHLQPDPLASIATELDDREVMFIEIIRDDDEPQNESPNEGEGTTMEGPADPETPLLIGRGFLATANAVIDCRMAKIAVGEGITRSVFGVKGVDLGEEEAPYWTTLGKRESYKPRPSSDGIGAKSPYYVRKDFFDCHLPRE
ncbi:hypothetical protein Tco_0988591 [Tanacetum coccineum]|uniref:Uncharacterized protein n=1 Tax=Tanacetum coccineum TaxID=301880 RepID=A0ABQ5ERJ6_9ASTR